ncbi:MAG: transposase [Parcubacteria group bacterium]
MTRFIGIRHRVKKTTKGEAHPTELVILEEGKEPAKYDLEDETAELDWLKGEFPIEFRKVDVSESLENFRDHQIDWKELKKEDEVNNPDNLLKREGKKRFLARKVPSKFDGLRQGDMVGITLGGSGDMLAYALSRRGEEIGAKVFSLPTHALKDNRVHDDKEKDALNVALLVRDKFALFAEVKIRQRRSLSLQGKLNERTDAMKERIACGQRLIQRAQGKIFMSEEGRYPEGKIIDCYEEIKANDKIYQAMATEEKEREKELKKLLEQIDVYKRIFEPIEGCGLIISATIIANAGEIDRFPTKAKFKAYCGAHVCQGGKYGDRDPQLQFPRRRAGEEANWIGAVRQAGFQITEQANKRPDSYWGRKLLEYKAKFRAKHPEPMEVQKVDNKGKPEFNKDGTPRMVKMYTNGHILKRARQRVATKFFEYLYVQMKQLSRELKAAEESLVRAAA